MQIMLYGEKFHILTKFQRSSTCINFIGINTFIPHDSRKVEQFCSQVRKITHHKHKDGFNHCKTKINSTVKKILYYCIRLRIIMQVFTCGDNKLCSYNFIPTLIY